MIGDRPISTTETPLALPLSSPPINSTQLKKRFKKRKGRRKGGILCVIELQFSSNPAVPDQGSAREVVGECKASWCVLWCLNCWTLHWYHLTADVVLFSCLHVASAWTTLHAVTHVLYNHPIAGLVYCVAMPTSVPHPQRSGCRLCCGGGCTCNQRN